MIYSGGNRQKNLILLKRACPLKCYSARSVKTCTKCIFAIELQQCTAKFRWEFKVKTVIFNDYFVRLLMKVFRLSVSLTLYLCHNQGKGKKENKSPSACRFF